MGIRVSG